VDTVLCYHGWLAVFSGETFARELCAGAAPPSLRVARTLILVLFFFGFGFGFLVLRISVLASFFWGFWVIYSWAIFLGFRVF